MSEEASLEDIFFANKKMGKMKKKKNIANFLIE